MRANWCWNISAPAKFHQALVEPKAFCGATYSPRATASSRFYKPPIHIKLQLNTKTSLFWGIFCWQYFLMNSRAEDSTVDAVDGSWFLQCMYTNHIFEASFATFNKEFYKNLKPIWVNRTPSCETYYKASKLRTKSSLSYWECPVPLQSVYGQGPSLRVT